MNEDDVRGIYDALIAGWNACSAASMAAPFAEDGVVIGFDGSVYVGPTSIIMEIGKVFADHDTARYVAKVQSVRPVGQSAAILLAIAGMIPPGQTQVNADTNAHQTLVAEQRDGRLQAVIFQNTPAQFHGRPELVEQMTQELQAVADAQVNRPGFLE